MRYRDEEAEMEFTPWPGAGYSNIRLDFGVPIYFETTDGEPVGGSNLGHAQGYVPTGIGPEWELVGDWEGHPIAGWLYLWTCWYRDPETNEYCSLGVPLQWDP